MRMIVLGCGLVGGPMAVDLAKDPGFEVTIVDRNQDALRALAGEHNNIETVHRDLGNPQDIGAVIADHDIVINAVPGFMGFQTLEAIIEAGKNVVDIAFYPENPFDLDALAEDRGVTAIVDCGVSPGLSNLLIGHVHERLDRTDSVLIYVGGLPVIRHWPFEYRAVFSPMDVIAEYTRPARFVENGRLVTRPALSDPELIDFPGVGTLEAFNTDGLRTLAETIDAPNMKEKTLRYPGHIEKMVFLREAGFFSEEPVVVDGRPIRPVDLTAELMFPQWQMDDGEVDITVLADHGRGRGARPGSTVCLQPLRPIRSLEQHPLHGPHHRLHRHHGGTAVGNGSVRPEGHLAGGVRGTRTRNASSSCSKASPIGASSSRRTRTPLRTRDVVRVRIRFC